MLEEKRSENILTDFYSSCPLFNKYRQFNFWFGCFDDYGNIIYCKNYMGKYICFLIHRYLLQSFSVSFVLFLYQSPRFFKFVESGFFRYLDFHFLLLFYNNSFSQGHELKINFFVQSYFQKYIKEKFKKDLLICISESISELILNSFRLKLAGRLKYLSTPSFVPDNTLIFPFLFLSRLNYRYLPTTYFKLLGRVHKSSKSISESINIVDSWHSKKIILNRFDKNIKDLYSYSGIQVCSLRSMQNDLGFINNEVYDLVDFLINVKDAPVNLGMYKNTTIIFEDNLNTRGLLLNPLPKNYVINFKGFYDGFLRHGYKKTSKAFTPYKVTSRGILYKFVEKSETSVYKYFTKR